MSERVEWRVYAAAALQGLLGATDQPKGPEEVAVIAGKFADAMVKEESRRFDDDFGPEEK